METIISDEIRGKRKSIGIISVLAFIATTICFVMAFSLMAGREESSGIIAPYSSHSVAATLTVAFNSGKFYIADPASDVNRWCAKDGTLLNQWGAHGKGDGEFDFPSGIAVNPDGLICVLDMYNYRIQIFLPDGTFIEKCV